MNPPLPVRTVSCFADFLLGMEVIFVILITVGVNVIVSLVVLVPILWCLVRRFTPSSCPPFFRRNRPFSVKSDPLNPTHARPPLNIFLIRHGESTANENDEVYRATPDHQVPLTMRGMTAAVVLTATATTTTTTMTLTTTREATRS